MTIKYLEWMTLRGDENLFLVFYFSLSAWIDLEPKRGMK